MHLVLVATTIIIAAKPVIVDMDLDHTAVVMGVLVVTLARKLTGTNPLYLWLRAVGTTSRLEVVTVFGKEVPSWI
jgi:hypothetical protein